MKFGNHEFRWVNQIIVDEIGHYKYDPETLSASVLRMPGQAALICGECGGRFEPNIEIIPSCPRCGFDGVNTVHSEPKKLFGPITRVIVNDPSYAQRLNDSISAVMQSHGFTIGVSNQCTLQIMRKLFNVERSNVDSDRFVSICGECENYVQNEVQEWHGMCADMTGRRVGRNAPACPEFK